MTRVFIISNHLMFGRGLESLLHHEPDLEIVGQETDLGRAIEQIKALQPDAVILDTNGSASEVMPILRASPGVKVIGLSLQNNELHVYQARQWVAQGVEDLMKAIKIDSAPAKPATITYNSTPQALRNSVSAPIR